MSDQNAYQCNACILFGPCFLFSNYAPTACPNQAGYTEWSLLVRGDSQ